MILFVRSELADQILTINCLGAPELRSLQCTCTVYKICKKPPMGSLLVKSSRKPLTANKTVTVTDGWVAWVWGSDYDWHDLNAMECDVVVWERDFGALGRRSQTPTRERREEVWGHYKELPEHYLGDPGWVVATTVCLHMTASQLFVEFVLPWNVSQSSLYSHGSSLR